LDEESLVFAHAPFAFVQRVPRRLKHDSVLAKTWGAFSAKLYVWKLTLCQKHL